jgi:uncharacterized protein (DUF2126 family)
VLGEQPTGGASVRYVDSSVERVRIKVRNMIGPRHVLTCNGRRVPLHPTGTAGEYAAGVRFRVSPYNALEAEARRALLRVRSQSVPPR